MTYKRRDFLKLGGGIAAGLAVMPLYANKLLSNTFDDIAIKQKPYGLQLYSLRDDMPKDPKGVLKQIASFGYQQIEGYEGSQGMFWNMGNIDFKKYMDDLGLDYIASHCNIDENFEEKAAQAAEIGMKYLICPSRDSSKTADEFKRVADEFNAKGEICRKNGIKFAYHNHEITFREVDGQIPQDILMTNTDPDLVDFEMDIYWVVTGKSDPIEWLEKYPNRFRLAHVKDRIIGATERGASCVLGTGSIDYKPIIKAAKKNGMKYFIVEHERYDDGTPLECVAADALYMNKLKL